MEECNCDQALAYRKAGRKLAKAVMRYAVGNQDKYGSLFYLAENVVPLAENFLKITKNNK